MQGEKKLSAMSLEEKHYMTGILDNHIKLLQNHINSNKILQFNTVFLIGTILIGTFGVILLGFLKPPEFSFSTKETNLAVIIFVLSTVSYLIYIITSIFYSLKRAEKTTSEYKAKAKIFGNVKIFSIHNFMKPLLSMVALSTISTLFLIPSFIDHRFIFPLLVFSMFVLSMEIIIIYLFIKKLLKKIKPNEFIRYSLLILPHLEKMTFLAFFKKGVDDKIIKSFNESKFYEKFRIISNFIFIFLLVLILLLPIIISFFIPIYYLIISFNITNITWVLIILVLVLQFILLYPLNKYYKIEVEVATFKEFYNRLNNLRNLTIFDNNLTYNSAIKIYYNILTEFPYDFF